MDIFCRGGPKCPPEGAHTGVPLRFVCILLTATRSQSGALFIPSLPLLRGAVVPLAFARKLLLLRGTHGPRQPGAAGGNGVLKSYFFFGGDGSRVSNKRCMP